MSDRDIVRAVVIFVALLLAGTAIFSLIPSHSSTQVRVSPNPGAVWGYCLDETGQAVVDYLDWEGWACVVESGPSDVGLLWSSDKQPAPPGLSNVDLALGYIPKAVTCPTACFAHGLFFLGSNARNTSAFSGGHQFQAYWAQSSSGQTYIGFDHGLIEGALVGVQEGGCASCPSVPVSANLDQITWEYEPLGPYTGAIERDLDVMALDQMTAGSWGTYALRS